ncbi:hypothetical protein SUGI_0380140 [Cryptomeria japonica]|uniref:RNA polymerase II C-terminal domain phosphatase-like 1 isoform X2 n=1 Tax=Cryptomeria japonica TaxID=3369 RepID=UPI002408A96F|nr:RNA polymerase II C-terminal domain phosphatase-like 1 isoform X2 [Cryptomeria japonica]GLJ20848.1 hypothetical protein SUGI_0380140 [Cryptomeria japonica]
MACEKLSSKLYHGDTYVGEVCIYPQYEDAYLMSIISKEIRISEFSSQSKRCSPLVVLHSIASNGVCFKMELKEQQSQLDHSNLISLHKSCLIEAKTAMITLGENELHLVAMLSEDRHDQVPCFWGFNVVSGLYGSCLGMLNLRCLAIVFDLDETLIVANTMRSFEDRIEALRRKILGEVDPQRVAGLSAEIKRYQQDQKILKQFCENDEVCDNGKLFKAQSEIAPAPSDNHLPLIRPIIRLHERNVILTRINPNIRDTSVLVRVRPAWEELRNYLIANGRKRFEVFVCTMSEKDYALEMWRLLDPETSLISPRELHDRVVCVKPGLRKSLVNVFHKGICHPKITMVIDDRLKVWEDTDQSHVHVVPAFAPYYAPLAETNVPLPILCVARNVACNVRGGFFKDFDEGHIQKMDEVVYETDVTKLSATPDVSNYLLTEAKAAANGNANLAVLNGTANSEIEKKLDLQDQNLLLNTCPARVLVDNQDPKSFMQTLQQAKPIVLPPYSAHTQPCVKVPQYSHGASLVVSSNSLPADTILEPSDNGSPGREEGEIPESECDPNMRRRLLILQHGQDPGQRDFNSYEPPLLRSMTQSSLPPNQILAGFVGAGKMCQQILKTSHENTYDSESQSFDICHLRNNSFCSGPETSLPSNRNIREFKRSLPKKVFGGDDELKRGYMQRDYSSLSGNHTSKPSSVNSGGFCNGKNGSGEKQSRDLQNAVSCKPMEADIPIASTSEQSKRVDPDCMTWSTEKISHEKDGDQPSLETQDSTGFVRLPCAGDPQSAGISAQATCFEQRSDDNGNVTHDPVNALKELCTKEGLSFHFRNQPLNGALNVMDSHAQVEVAGQILGKSNSPVLEAAKLQAAEEALKNLKASIINQQSQKRLNSNRMSPDQPNKRIKQEEFLEVGP